ncbi:MAG TPA: class I tRNA ligase family protein [Arenibaculum sp.]|nr:class I tRNA ligase family protein [Arenibaculum sp.]
MPQQPPAREKARTSGYPFTDIEPAWQARWEEAGIFRADRDDGDERPKWFVMDLPPFANGSLHLGHARNYVMADACARFRRMAGYNVLYTSGFDTFGLPNETAARDAGCPPLELAERCSDLMARQFVRLGLGHDRRRIIGYHTEEYYRWIQWVFLKLLEAGHCFRRKEPVNWCPRCDTALAESLVEDGKCWRCGVPAELRETEQWFVREVDFADAMLDGLPRLHGWPETIKRIHADWIGRREGVEVRLRIGEGGGCEDLVVFLEDPASLDAMAFVAVGPDHPIAGLPVGDIADARLLGVDAAVPLSGRTVPLVGLPAGSWTGGEPKPGLPALDPRDRALADQLGIAWEPIPAGPAQPPGAALAAVGAGGPAVRYRLRDWNVARQRYWGPPVPVIHCEDCGMVPVAEDDLPVVLPLDVDLAGPGNPLERHPAFARVDCPRCGRDARRDTDTLEAYSSPWWYHWNCKSMERDYPFAGDDERYWLPVDVMIGGVDQARTCFFHVRMIAKALTRMGIAATDEPIDTLLALGMIKTDGRKMSKSGGNAASLDDLIAAYGADAVRLGILSAAAPENDFNWSDDTLRRANAFLGELWEFVAARAGRLRPGMEVADLTANKLHRRLAGWLETAQARVTGDMVRHNYHLAARNVVFLSGRLVQFDKEARRNGDLGEADGAALATGLRTLLRLMAPLAPHLAEELWPVCGGEGMLAVAPWPVAVPAAADDASGPRRQHSRSRPVETREPSHADR